MLQLNVHQVLEERNYLLNKNNGILNAFDTNTLLLMFNNLASLSAEDFRNLPDEPIMGLIECAKIVLADAVKRKHNEFN